VPLNSLRLLIRLRMCRKSGTVPLNSPRLLIRHWISFPGLHTDIHTNCKRSLCPARHRPTTHHYTPYFEIMDDTILTGDTVRRTHSTHLLGDPKTSTKTESSNTNINRRGPYPRVHPIT
jgi:hypothetical protein